MKYNIADVLLCYDLFNHFYNLSLLDKIEDLRKEIDNCDDYQMREYLVKKLNRLKFSLNKSV